MKRIASSRMFSGAAAVAAMAAALSFRASAQEIADSAITVLEGHAEPAYDVAFSPNSKLVASASYDRTVKLWEVAGGTLVTTFSGHDDKVLAVAFSPDGGTLLSAGADKSVRLWSVPGSGPEALAGHSGKVRALAMSADGRKLATAAADGTVIIFDPASRESVLSVKGSPALAVAFSPDGSLVAAGCEDGTARAWALPVPEPEVVATAAGASADLIAAGQPWRYHKGESAPAAEWATPDFDDSKWASGDSGFGYSSNAEELATVKTRLDDMAQKYLSVYIRKEFPLEDPKGVERLGLRVVIDDAFVAYLNGEEVGRTNVEGSPPAHTATASAAGEPQEVAVDLTPHLGKLRAGKNVLAIQGHNAGPTSSDFVLTPILSATLKAAAPEPKPEEKKPVEPGTELFRLADLGGPVAAIAFSPDGKRLAASGKSGVVRVAVLGGEHADLEVSGGAIGGLAFVDGDTVAAGCEDGAVRLLAAASGEEKASLTGHQGPVKALAASSDRALLASSGQDGSVRLWSVGEKKETRAIAGDRGPVLAVAFSPDDRLVVAGCASGSVHTWNAGDGSEVSSFQQEGGAGAVAASANERFYSGGQGNDVLVWRAATGGELKNLSGHGGMVHAVAFSPDGLTAASGGTDKTVRIWDLAEGKEARAINAHEGSVYTVAYSPSGAVLASGGYDKVIKLWNPGDGAELRKLEGHEEGIFALVFSSDGASLISASSDRTLRVWNVESGEAVRTLSGHPGWIMDVQLLPGGRAVSGDYGGHILLWDLAGGEKQAEHRVAGTVHGLAASPDGKWLATASSKGAVFLFATP